MNSLQLQRRGDGEGSEVNVVRLTPETCVIVIFDMTVVAAQ